jgi:hypothetical protein
MWVFQKEKQLAYQNDYKRQANRNDFQVMAINIRVKDTSFHNYATCYVLQPI